MMLQELSKRFHAHFPDTRISTTANNDVEELVTWAGKAQENKIRNSLYPTCMLDVVGCPDISYSVLVLLLHCTIIKFLNQPENRITM